MQHVVFRKWSCCSAKWSGMTSGLWNEGGLGLSDFLRVPTSATTQTNTPPFETLILIDHLGLLD